MKAKKWTNDDDNFLIQNYFDKSIEYISNKLDRTKHSIVNRARVLRLKRGKRIYSRNITYEEREKLFNYGYGYCNNCRKILPIECFSKENRNFFGYRHECRKCRNEKKLKSNSKKHPNINCDFCKKPFYRRKSAIYKNNFCSQECNKEWRRTKMKKKNINKKQYSKEQEEKMHEMLLGGYSYSEISENTGLKMHQIYLYRKNKNIEYIGKFKYKSELHRKLYNILKQLFPNNELINECYIKDTGQYFDIYDLDLNIAYEANGIQHYIQKNTWNRTDGNWIKQLERDKRKKDYCNKNKIPLIVVRYDEDLTENLIIEKLSELGISYKDVLNTSLF